MGVENELALIQDYLDEVTETVQNYPEPGGRLLLAAQVYELIRKTIVDLGAYGIRGEAATQLIQLYGTAKNAAEFINNRYDIEVTPSTLNRLAKR